MNATRSCGGCSSPTTLLPGDVGDAAVAELDEVLGGQARAVLVVTGDDRRRAASTGSRAPATTVGMWVAAVRSASDGGRGAHGDESVGPRQFLKVAGEVVAEPPVEVASARSMRRPLSWRREFEAVKEFDEPGGCACR